MTKEKHPLPGSARTHEHFTRSSGLTREQLAEKHTFKLVLRHDSPPDHRPGMTRNEYLESLKASDEAVEGVTRFAEDHGLNVDGYSPVSRTITLTGTLGQIQDAFNIRFFLHPHDDGNYLTYHGELHLPGHLHRDVIGAMGLHFRPSVKPKANEADNAVPQTGAKPAEVVFNNYATVLAELYDFPDGLDGAGQNIAILTLGGGYRSEDISAYFSQLGLDTPEIVDISVNGGSNTPVNPPDLFTLEVYSDIYMAASVAPKAKVLVYFANDNHLHTLMEAFQEAVYDVHHAPDIISSSYGSSESEWNANDIDILESILADAKNMRITVFAAAGDAGSGNGQQGANVDYPASSPYVTGCGGTVAMVKSDYSQITSEVVWNGQGGRGGATGGGVSERFPLPDWQKNAGVPSHVFSNKPGRGVPDMAGLAGFYKIWMYGQPAQTGGTSCVAPFYAGLIALANQKAGENIGFVNPSLYAMSNSIRQSVFIDISKGNNGDYSSQKGWDACTGWGRPRGKALVDALVKAAKQAV